MPNLKLKSWTESTLSDIIVPRYNSVYRMPYHINVDWICLVKLFKIDKVHMFHKSNWRCNIFLVTIEHIYIFLKQKNFIDPIWIVWLQMKSSGKFLVFFRLLKPDFFKKQRFSSSFLPTWSRKTGSKSLSYEILHMNFSD